MKAIKEIAIVAVTAAIAFAVSYALGYFIPVAY